MFTSSNLLLVGLIISSFIILFQDFKERLVSLWVLMTFGLMCLTSVILNRDVETLLYGILCTVIYMGFIWGILKLYMYLKFKKNKAIIDELIGLADVLVIFFIGITFNAVGLILFFCFGFIFSLICYVLYTSISKNKINEHIPLAGLLVGFYLFSVFMLYLVELTNYIDCSFVN